MKTIRYAIPLLLACAWSIAQPARAEARMPPVAREFGMPPLPMHMLKLSDEQDDRIHAILHAQEPTMRKLQRTAAKQHEAMRALGDAVPFDERKAAALAQEAGALHAEALLQRVRTHAQVLAVLTPEQRKQLAELPHGRPGRSEAAFPGGRPHGRE